MQREKPSGPPSLPKLRTTKIKTTNSKNVSRLVELKQFKQFGFRDDQTFTRPELAAHYVDALGGIHILHIAPAHLAQAAKQTIQTLGQFFRIFGVTRAIWVVARNGRGSSMKDLRIALQKLLARLCRHGAPVLIVDDEEYRG